jgi:uncharacterized phage protein (TIGR01671 family)
MSNTDQSGRDLKFRAWDKRISKMLKTWVMDFRASPDYIMVQNEWPNNGGPAKEPWGNTREHIILMQFSGHQINGVDVYESDIVRLEENDEGADPEDRMTWYVVTWIKEWCMFALLRVSDEYKEYMADGAGELDTTMFWTFPLDLEDWPNSKHYLCGNIFENSNLLNHV